MTPLDYAKFECVIADGARRISSANLDGSGGAVKTWSIDSAFLVATDAFEFEFVAARDEDKDGLALAPVELFIDGQSMMHGRIDIPIMGDKGPSIVTVKGRDYLADLVESDVDPTVSVAAGATLEDAILQACAPCGIVGVEGPEARQQARTKAPQKPTKRPRKHQLKDSKPEPGQGVYDWSNRILARHGLTMQPASDPSRIVLQAPNYSQDPMGRIVRRDYYNPGNVVRGVATRDFSKFPTYALFTGRQGAPKEASSRTKNQWDLSNVAKGFSAELYDILQQWTVAGRRLPKNRSALIPRALYRLLYFRDEKATTQEQIDASALRAVAERLKDTLRYEVTLHGLINPDTGYYWAVDTIVEVDDAVTRINEKLWVASRKFAFDGERLTTTLECWSPGSFQIGDPNG